MGDLAISGIVLFTIVFAVEARIIVLFYTIAAVLGAGRGLCSWG